MELRDRNMKRINNKELAEKYIAEQIEAIKKQVGNKKVLLALECKKLGIDKVLIVCDKDNIGSRKSIINNGGVLENEIVGKDGRIEQRYWMLAQ